MAGKKNETPFGQEHGTLYLVLALLGIIVPFLGIIMLVLSWSDKSKANKEGRQLDQSVFVAWVVSLVVTIMTVLATVFAVIVIGTTSKTVIDGFQQTGEQTQEYKSIQQQTEQLQKELSAPSNQP